MSRTHPSSHGIARIARSGGAGDNTAISHTITVPSGEFAIIYRIDVAINASTESDLEEMTSVVSVSLTIAGGTRWAVWLHPFVSRTASETTGHYDLGPWSWDWGAEGIYGNAGEQVVVLLGAISTNVQGRLSIIYGGGTAS